MNLNFNWLLDLMRPVSPSDKEQYLELEAKKLEQRAEHVENVARLHKRIVVAKKRISTAGGSGITGLLSGKNTLIVLGIVVVVVLVIAKSC